MTPVRLAIASCVAVLLLTGAMFDLRAARADNPSVPKSASPAPVPPAPVPPAPTRIGSAQFRHNGWHSRVFLTDGGNTLLVVAEGVVLRWWDLQTGKKLHEITLKGNHHDAAFAPEADVLAVVGTHQPHGRDGDFEYVLWLIDAAGRKLVRTVVLPNRLVGNGQKVRISADGKRVVVEHEGDVQVIDGKTGDELMRHKGSINAGTLAVSRDGKLIAFGRFDVFLWHWETGEEPKEFTSVDNFGTELMQFSPDGKTLYIVPRGGVVTMWDVASGRQSGSRALRAMVGNLEFRPDGRTLAVSTHPGTSRLPESGHEIELLDTATWKEVGRIPLGGIGIGHMSWSKDGSRLAGVTDYRAWAWDVKTGKALGPAAPGHEGPITAMAFGPDGTLFTASDDHTIRSWDPDTGAMKLVLSQDGWVRGLAVSPDGALVAGSALRNDLRVWDAKTGKLRFKLLGNGAMGGKRRVQFSADGKYLLASGDDELIRVWEVRNGKLISEQSTSPPRAKSDSDDPFEKRMQFMRASFEAADISPNGAALALTSAKGLRLLDPMTGKEQQTASVGSNRPHAIAFSPDAKRVAVAYRGKPVRTKLPDGRTRFSTEEACPVAIWDLASRKRLWTATVEGNWPEVAYAPDGSKVAAVSSVWQGPSRVWVWDAATGREAARIELPHRGQHLAFDRSGKRLAVSLDDTTALVYNLETSLKPAK